MSNDQTEQFSPNGIEEYDGDEECREDSCTTSADWEISLIDRHGNGALTYACDDHVAQFWGYHPDEQFVTDGGHLPSDTVDTELGPEFPEQYAEELRRDEFEKLESQEGYPVYRWKVGGKEPDGKPTRIGKWTFATKMVRDVVLDHVYGRVLNACAGKTKLRKRGCEFVRNDIDEDIDADLHVDVREIDQHFEPETFDSVILDLPFDPGRAAKLYEGWHGQEYSHARDAVAPLVRPGGTVVELGWNSYGLHDVNDEDRPTWERQAWYVYPQASFKGDVHLTVDRKVNQQTLDGVME